MSEAKTLDKLEAFARNLKREFRRLVLLIINTQIYEL